MIMPVGKNAKRDAAATAATTPMPAKAKPTNNLPEQANEERSNSYNAGVIAAKLYSYSKAISKQMAWSQIRLALETTAFLEAGTLGTLLSYYIATRVAEAIMLANLFVIAAHAVLPEGMFNGAKSMLSAATNDENLTSSIENMSDVSSKFTIASNATNWFLLAISITSPSIVTLPFYLAARWAVNETADNCVKVENATKTTGKKPDIQETLLEASKLTAHKVYSEGATSAARLMTSVKSTLHNLGMSSDIALNADQEQKAQQQWETGDEPEVIPVQTTTAATTPGQLH